MDEEGVLDFLTSLEAMDLPDRIEEVNSKILLKIIEDTDFVAVLFCKFFVVFISLNYILFCYFQKLIFILVYVVDFRTFCSDIWSIYIQYLLSIIYEDLHKLI